MAVYRPKRTGVQSRFYVCEFVIHGKRIQESTGAAGKTVAKEYEKRRRAELERAAAGLPVEEKAPRLRTASEVCQTYLAGYRLAHRPASITFAESRLKQITSELGTLMLSQLTEERIREYIRKRKHADASGRTINMEIGELSRAVGRTWRELWPKVKKMEERKDIGKALSSEEQRRLLDALEFTHSQTLHALVPMLLLTGMRSGEATTLQWSQTDLENQLISVGRAKTSSGTGRVIPINPELAHVIAAHKAWFAEAFGEPKPEHYVFPFGHPVPLDPSRHITDVKWAWTKLRRTAKVRCRLHDLRHTFATGLAERGVSESTMLALMGHMSRAMLERYSHIRMAAKVAAVAGLTLRPKGRDSEVVPVKVPVVEQSATVQ